jgi:hypothetical protein
VDKNLTKIGSDLTSLIAKLAGPLADEFGQILGDKAREYRYKNVLKIFQRVQKMLADAGISPLAIPPRMFIPTLEAASIEDNETLQERWAALLANASDPHKSTFVQPSFVDALKQLTPEQAAFLDTVLDRVTMNGRLKPHITHAGIKIGTFNVLLQIFGGDRSQQEVFTDERLRENVTLKVDDLVRLGIINRVLFDEQTLRNVGSKITNITSINQVQQLFKADTAFYLTPFGLALIEACTTPLKKETDAGLEKAAATPSNNA